MPGIELLALQISEEYAETMSIEIRIGTLFVRDPPCGCTANAIKCLYND